MLSEYSKQANPDFRDEKYTNDDPPGNTGNLNLRSEFPLISGGIPDNSSFTDPTASNITQGRKYPPGRLARPRTHINFQKP